MFEEFKNLPREEQRAAHTRAVRAATIHSLKEAHAFFGKSSIISEQMIAGALPKVESIIEAYLRAMLDGGVEKAN